MSLQELTKQLVGLKSVFYDAGIDHVALFGSYARGDAKQSSDVDLLYTRSKDAGLFLTLEKYMKLKRKIKKTLGMSIDLIPEQGLQKSFAQEIKKEKITIF